MNERVPTLLIYANGVSWKAFLADTFVRGIFRLKGERLFPRGLPEPGFVRKLMTRHRNETLSYVDDWMDAFSEAPELEVKKCNISNLVEFHAHKQAIKDFPLIIILHSAAGDNITWLLRSSRWFQGRRGKLLVFIGNEYSLIPEKLEFINSVQAQFIASQLPLDSAEWLYGDCESSQLIEAPHALNPKIYFPDPEAERGTDIGFIGSIYPFFIGDNERTELIRWFEKHGAERGLSCEIRDQRLPREQWASFLNTCKGIIGAESGTYYLDRTGEAIDSALHFISTHPDATFADVYEAVFKERPRVVSGKAISSRHFEPAGTLTCQLLLEGEYNGILRPDEHYISIKKDLSNIHDAADRFQDHTYRDQMVRHTYEYVMDQHTYSRRVGSILRTVL